MMGGCASGMIDTEFGFSIVQQSRRVRATRVNTVRGAGVYSMVSLPDGTCWDLEGGVLLVSFSCS